MSRCTIKSTRTRLNDSLRGVGLKKEISILNFVLALCLCWFEKYHTQFLALDVCGKRKGG